MNSIPMTLLKETTRNLKENIYKYNNKYHSPKYQRKKKLFSIQPLKPLQPTQDTYTLLLDNAMPQRKSKEYEREKMVVIKKENVLDFDKILDVLLGNKKVSNDKSHTMKKCIGNKTKRNNKKNNTHNSKNKDKNKMILKKKDSKYCGYVYHKKRNDLYDINNFCSNTLKIVEKKQFVKIECPKFREIDDTELEMDNMFQDNEDENITEDKYLTYHKRCEKEEIDYHIKLYNESYFKKSSKKKTNCSITTQCSSSSEGMDDNWNTTTNESVKDNNNLIIRICLDE